MSIYPGDKPHYGTITAKQYLQLQALPTLLAALDAAVTALKDPYCGEDDGKREAPVVFLLEKTLKKFKELGVEPPVEAAKKIGILNEIGEECADRAREAVNHYEAMSNTDDSDEGSMTDLLTDLMFLADREDLDFDRLLLSAEMHYEEER